MVSVRYVWPYAAYLNRPEQRRGVPSRLWRSAAAERQRAEAWQQVRGEQQGAEQRTEQPGRVGDMRLSDKPASE